MITRWWPEICIVLAISIALREAQLFAARFPYGNFLYHYQTLITGVLAVGAACITIRQMLRIDMEQGERHRQTLSFAIRSELRTMDRALYPALQQVNEISKQVELINFSFENENAGDTQRWIWYSEVARPLNKAISSTLAVIEHDPFKGGADYFDGQLLGAFLALQRSASRAEKQLTKHIEVLDTDPYTDYSGVSHYEHRVFEDHGMHFVESAFIYFRDLATFCQALETASIKHRKLKDIYAD
ncbi:hypothetical protein RMR16_008765 [Agrobacterium sp. rho-13.3]|uniref:hypothetical protein n=1 Tax=Agrobacterium sp. rho-13.3 TaxID=3072980 RepID=UPI002A105B09|nr:hypothetical protein [Agrobacterium sp. rho-13.3]MDX8310042.1 hypothetical protein [Agrobacterium sp. rho-13.3]